MKNIFWLMFWLTPLVAFSQEKATFSFQNKLLSEVLFSIEKTYNIRFSYQDNIINKKRISISSKEKTLTEILLEIEENNKIVFKKINSRYYIIKETSNLKTTQQLNEIIINNYLTKGISKNKKGFFNINPNKLEILPGLIEADVLESIQQLPGVISPNETASGLTVRGGTSDQNNILWDGINIYHNGHLFGMISAFNPNVANNISFYKKGTNPRFGESVSSVIDIKTDDEITKNTNVIFSVNGINTDVILKTPLIEKKLSLQLSARRSYSDLFQTPTYKQIAKKVFQNTKVSELKNTSNKFYFIDYNSKINYKLNKNNLITFSAIIIDNHLNNTNNDIKTTDILSIKNEGYAVNWNKKWNKNTSLNNKISFSKYHFNYNLIKSENDIQISDFDKRNIIYDTNINSELNIKTSKNNNINIGYQFSFKDVSYAYLNTTNVELLLDYNKQTLKNHSLYSNYSYNKLFNFDLGFRLNYYQDFNKIKFEPRFLAFKQITEHIKIQATGELKSQTINQIDETVLSDLSLENRLWRLSDNDKVPIVNSGQVSLGLLYKENGWSSDIDFYIKNIDGMTSLSLGFLNPSGQAFYIGNQKTNGVDFYLKKELYNLNLWTSYSFTEVKSQYQGLNNNKYFTSNTSINHAISSSISYKIKQFQIALGWKWRTGKPYTKSVIDNNNIIFEGINTERLPNYHRLDFSSTYKFTITKKRNLKAKIGVSIRNVYNQKNQLSREYTGYNSIDDPIVIQDKYSLGITPNFLFKIYW